MSIVKKYVKEGKDLVDDFDADKSEEVFLKDDDNKEPSLKEAIKPKEAIEEEPKQTEEPLKQKIKEETKEDADAYVPAHNIKENNNVKKESIIKPNLKFLEDDDFVYIGRKKSVLKQYGQKGSSFLGKVVEEDQINKKVRLDGLNPHVVFIDGSRGSGKSYGLGVIAEELALNNEFIGQIVVDPVGVFWSMKFPNREKKELDVLKEWGLEPKGLDNLKVFVPEGVASQISKETYDETFSLFPSLLSVEDWCLTFGIDRFSPTGLLLEKTLSFVKDGYIAGDTKEDAELKEILPKGSQFTLEDIIFCLRNNNDYKSSQKGYKPDSIRALVSRFEAAKSWGIFTDHGTPLSKLSRERQLTILDTSFLDDNITALVIGILARRILAARKLVTRQDAISKLDPAEQNPDLLLEIEIPPTWLYIDEAHTLIPSGNTQTPATASIIEYVKQGRRPGCSLVFATQQPSAINSKVLSQVDIFISHKLVFNDDINAIHKRMPAIIPEDYKKPNFIKTLPVGVALVGDRCEETSRAFILKVKPRLSQHEGRDTETIRVVDDLSEEEVIDKAVDLIISKIEKASQIKELYAKDILDILNTKYHKSVSWKKVLQSLRENNVVLKDGLLFMASKPIKQEKSIEQIKKEVEALENNEALEDDEEDDNSLEDEDQEDIEEVIVKEQSEICYCLPQRISRENAEIVSKKTVSKKFLFFKDKETINDSFLKHSIIYKISFNFYSSEDHFRLRTCYVDSMSGELIHFTGDSFKFSKGLSFVDSFSNEQLKLLSILRKQSTIYSLTQDVSFSEDVIKKNIEVFKEKKLVDVNMKHDVEVYKVSKNFDVPYTPEHKILESLKDLPLTKKKIIMSNKLEPRKNIEKISKTLEKLWKNIEITSVEEIYWPVWHIILVDDNFKERVVFVDGVLGMMM